MIDIFEKQFDALSQKIQTRFKQLGSRLWAYLRRLLFPVYFFPLKLVTYTIYYLLLFIFRFVISLIKILLDTIFFPFRSLKNFLKAVFILGVVVYMAASLFVIADYLRTQYGAYGKFFCSISDQGFFKERVVRIVGAYSEGSGFFISPNQVLTNFHVIADEPTPKVILADGTFLTPTKILGNDQADIAVLELPAYRSSLVIPLPDKIEFNTDETVLAIGYPMGTDLVGEATILRGKLISLRQSKQLPVAYVQSDIDLIEGMSGGPLVDQCGNLLGINTMGIGGLSLFIAAPEAYSLVPQLTDDQITKIKVDPAASPADAVTAFYTYLKARRMEDGYGLLSSSYLEKTDLMEWNNRFVDILDVTIYSSVADKSAPNTVLVKFSTKNWVDSEVVYHFYQGTWETVLEDGVYKMNKSKIVEVDSPGWEWFYE